MIYITFAIISCIALKLSSKIVLVVGSQRLKDRSGEIITIILMTLLTAFRSITIGSDTLNYYYSAQNIINNYSSISDIFKGYYIEPGYGLLEFISMKYIGDVHFLFFIEGLVLICGLFSFIHNFEKKISYSLSFFVFFVFYFNSSLNISRQFLAVGIGFFATKYMLREKWKQYFILCAVAMLIHSTAILLFFSYFIWIYINKSSSDNEYRRKLLSLIICIIAGIIMFVPISSIMIKIGLLPAKYADFLKANSSASSLVLSLIAHAPLLILIFFLNKRIIEYDNRNRMVITMCLFGFAISLLNSVIGNVGRLSVYWSSWQIILYPECYEVLRLQNRNEKSRFIITISFLLFFFLYWYYSVVFRQFGGTFPYKSDLLPLLNW